MRLFNKIVFVTNAQHPCAGAIVTSFAREGANCFVLDENAAEAEQLAARVRSLGRRVLALQSDLTKKTRVEEAVKRAVGEFGRIDVLLNCSAVTHENNFLDFSEESFSRCIDRGPKASVRDRVFDVLRLVQLEALAERPSPLLTSDCLTTRKSETPDDGEIFISGQVVFSKRDHIYVPPEDRQIGVVFQSYAIWPHMTVFDNVALPLIYGCKRIQKHLRPAIQRSKVVFPEPLGPRAPGILLRGLPD